MKLNLFRNQKEESEEITDDDIEIIGMDERFYDSSIFSEVPKNDENDENQET